MKKNTLNKILFIILVIVLMWLLMTIKSYAKTSISISTSKSKVAPGGTFTVTVSAKGAGMVTTSVSNGSGGKTDFLDNSSYSFTCTAGSSGSVTIYASGTLGDYATNKDTNRSASKTLKIVSNSGAGTSGGGSSGRKSSSSSSGSSSSGGYSSNNSNKTTPEETEKSSDSTLNGLTVKEGKITPEFKKDVKEYALTIPYETSEINVTATPTDSKATVNVKGNKKLKEGENTVTVVVTAEDGSTSNYTIKVTRARVPIALKSLIIKYENQNGELIETPLNPTFAFNTLEYTLEDLEYWVEKLSIGAVPNIEGATVDIQGADNLQIGENTITITLKTIEDQKNLKKGEEPKEETISYTIKVNKKKEPTLMAKISDWFKGVMGTVSTWYGQNEEKVILGALGVCIVALLGLSIYIVVDYNKYKDVIEKAKKTVEISSTENIIEQIHKNSDNVKEKYVDDEKNDKLKGGKHF